MQTRAEQIESLKNALMKVKDQLIEAGYKVDFEALERYKQQITPYYFKEPKMSTFKVGDRVRFVQVDLNDVGSTPRRCVGLEVTVTSIRNSVHNGHMVMDVSPNPNLPGMATEGWDIRRFELVKPQFKKGDKLRLVGPERDVFQDQKPWDFVSIGGDGRINAKFEGGIPRSFLSTSFELWDLKEKPMNSTSYNPKKANSPEYSMLPAKNGKTTFTPTDANSLGQSKPVNCAICNKEHANINEVGDIIGGCVLDGPVKVDGKQNEEMVIGPCCYPRIMDTIMDLKTKTNVTTTSRENATNSWMPHDEEGNL